jgi:Xaa-Pro aminopeptidase
VLFLGSIPRSIEEIYGVVLSAQQEAFEASAPGRPLGEIDEAARGLITQAGFGELFGHALGHGVGLEVHERPTVRHSGKEVAQAGMVYTIEPGIYRPGVGGVRIEDMVLVGEVGAERMTSLPREMEDMVV